MQSLSSVKFILSIPGSDNWIDSTGDTQKPLGDRMSQADFLCVVIFVDYQVNDWKLNEVSYECTLIEQML